MDIDLNILRRDKGTGQPLNLACQFVDVPSITDITWLRDFSSNAKHSNTLLPSLQQKKLQYKEIS